MDLFQANYFIFKIANGSLFYSDDSKKKQNKKQIKLGEVFKLRRDLKIPVTFSHLYSLSSVAKMGMVFNS